MTLKAQLQLFYNLERSTNRSAFASCQELKPADTILQELPCCICGTRVCALEMWGFKSRLLPAHNHGAFFEALINLLITAKLIRYIDILTYSSKVRAT